MKCPMCDGKGEINNEFTKYMESCGQWRENEVQTNEEWLRQANKEEMEHTLTMLIMKDRFFADKEFAYVNIRFGVHCWLKEKHTNE